MKLINKSSMMEKIIKKYQYSNNYDIYDCYNYSISSAKLRAYEYCKELYKKYNGFGFKIISFNTYQFSVGFYGYYFNRLAFFYITKDYDRVCYVISRNKEQNFLENE